jgi:hypothetical protein
VQSGAGTKVVALRNAGWRLISASLCFRLPCGCLAFVKRDELRCVEQICELDLLIVHHVTCVEESKPYTLVWCCLGTLVLCTDALDIRGDCCSFIYNIVHLCLRQDQMVGEAAAVSSVWNARNG